MIALSIALLALMAATLWTVLAADLLRSAIGLAVTSVVLTLLLFRMDEPLAGVFELSVCAGLITVVFISTISLTKPMGDAEVRHIRNRLNRWKRYVFLPVVLVAVGYLLGRGMFGLELPARISATEDVRQVMWFARRFDLIGQILVILVGVFGVIVLFKAKGSPPGGANK